MAPTSVSMPLILLTRIMQWSSSVIVMGITSYCMRNWPKWEHTIYQEDIMGSSIDKAAVNDVGYFSPSSLPIPLHG
ncbi:hypothetical protein N7451_012130 [Penicillium sp. IBT 35674x]|nr:hypothetical protein N7451_012130 [Penicillium sp. IBT 35674x]